LFFKESLIGVGLWKLLNAEEKDGLFIKKNKIKGNRLYLLVMSACYEMNRMGKITKRFGKICLAYKPKRRNRIKKIMLQVYRLNKKS